MAKKTITIKQLEELGKQNQNDFESLEASDLINSASDAMRDWMRERGLYIENEVIYFDTDKLDEIGKVANSIIDEDWSVIKSIWGEDGYFDGGDDFDYNGSYICELVDLLRMSITN
jgi:hypothetical protein